MSGKGRAPKGSVRRKQRKKSAVELQSEGKNERQIAVILGISKSESHRLLAEANAEARPDPELVSARRDRIRNVVDAQVLVWAPKALKNKDAANVLTRLLDRLAKLDGVDAPAKVDMTLASREIDRWLDNLEKNLSFDDFLRIARLAPGASAAAASAEDSGVEVDASGEGAGEPSSPGSGG